MGLIDLTGDDMAALLKSPPPSYPCPITSSGSDYRGLKGGDDDHGDIRKIDLCGKSGDNNNNDDNNESI